MKQLPAVTGSLPLFSVYKELPALDKNRQGKVAKNMVIP
jgi:hypothetical protein